MTLFILVTTSYKERGMNIPWRGREAGSYRFSDLFLNSFNVILDWRITEPFMYWCVILWRTLELNSMAKVLGLK